MPVLGAPLHLLLRHRAVQAVEARRRVHILRETPPLPPPPPPLLGLLLLLPLRLCGVPPRAGTVCGGADRPWRGNPQVSIGVLQYVVVEVVLTPAVLVAELTGFYNSGQVENMWSVLKR